MMPISVGDMIIHDEYTTMGNKSSLHFAMRRFMERPQSVIIVVDEYIRPLGVVYPKHMFTAIERGEDLDRCLVDSIMSTNIIKVKETDLITDVIDKVKSRIAEGQEAEAIIVVDDEGRLKGYFSLSEDEKEVMNQIQAIRHLKDILKEMD